MIISESIDMANAANQNSHTEKAFKDFLYYLGVTFADDIEGLMPFVHIILH